MALALTSVWDLPGFKSSKLTADMPQLLDDAVMTWWSRAVVDGVRRLSLERNPR
jgi:hypothetical protein